MKIILAAIDEPLALAWEEVCKYLPDVEIYRGSILDLDVDAIVSPANSFGFMDGGIDALYLKKWPHMQLCLQTYIKADWNGELPVGCSKAIFQEGKPKLLIVAPTMRVPMVLPKDSVNPYLATRSALLTARRFAESNIAAARVESIAFPGMGTGVGGFSPNLCAWQMRQAIIMATADSPDYCFPETWVQAVNNHASLFQR